LPLYEIVLCFPDRTEIRITDRDPQADGHVRVNGVELPIASESVPDTARAARRYVVRVEAVAAESSRAARLTR
jgi:hypothetical protein